MSGHPKITRIKLERYPSLGADIELELADKVTLLVGRNASGKSLVFENLQLAMYAAIKGPGWSVVGESRAFECTVNIADNAYTYRYEFEVVDSESPTDMPIVRWVEWCKCGERMVWEVSDGDVSFEGKPPSMQLPEGTGLLMVRTVKESSVADVADKIRVVFSNLKHLHAGLPRSFSDQRQEVHLVKVDDIKKARRGYSRLSLLVGRIVTLYESDKDVLFRQLIERFKRVSGQMLNVVFYHRSHERQSAPSGEDYADVLVDEHNVGVASDGTLRTLELLLGLTDAHPGALLTIEEPETGIHPYMLGRVLNEVESGSLSSQIILSTHSVQVLDWAASQPGVVRLVERKDRVTTVRKLSEDELDCARTYLQNDGSFGEYIFGGGIDTDGD